MAVPRSRQSNARKNKRRSHMAKKPVFLTKCSFCGEETLPHRICFFCKSFYKNKKEK